MPESIHQRLNNLKVDLLNRADPAPSKLADICTELLGLIEQNRSDLTELYESQVRVDQRLNALEANHPGRQGA
jgi:hypothetical protein